MNLDLAVRGASVLIVPVMLHQLWLSKGGSVRHKAVGRIGMALGAFLVVVTAMRGAQEESITTLYAIHLVIGTLFYVCFFATGFFGRKSKYDSTWLPEHRLLARVSAVLLIATLVIGIVSRMSH